MYVCVVSVRMHMDASVQSWTVTVGMGENSEKSTVREASLLVLM